jgi:hypothetical protein
MEDWRPITDFPDYEVSNQGNVRSKYSGNWKVLTQYKDNHIGGNYCLVMIYNKTKRKTIRVHRLVAQAFVPNPENKPEIDHIDRNRQNNNVENLRWATKSENMLNTKRSA